MKIKQGFYGAAAIGIAISVLRILQYILSIDAEGYYKAGGLSSFLSGMLIGLLAVGAIWSILCGFKMKAAVSFRRLIGEKPIVKVCFAALGISGMASGVLKLIGAKGTLPILGAVLILAGGICWLLLAIKGSLPGLAVLLPVAGIIAEILLYFWNTYKFIQVSEYALVLLGLCCLCLFTLLLMKALAGADCSKGRLATAACFTLIFGGAAFLAPLAGGITPDAILRGIEGIAFILLAAFALKQLPGADAPATEETWESPDLSHLNEYISNLPEVEENENENT